VARPRFQSVLLASFAGLALLLAAIGIFGVMSYSVAQRSHEIGIRVALGAQRYQVLRLVVGQGLLLALIGIAAGLAGALALTRYLRSLLFEVSPTDPWTFVGVPVILCAVAVAASYFPARRAARVDPIVALRYE
jgi:putative ABC transport system permease protein